MQFKDLDWSDETTVIGFVSMLAIGTFSAIAVGMQRRRVRLNGSAELLPYPAYFGQFGLFMSTLFYGFNFQFLALIIITPIRVIIIGLLITDMMKMVSMTRVDKFFLVLTIILITLCSTPLLTIPTTLVIGVYALYYFVLIPVRMWRENSRGSVSVWSMVAFCVSQGVWTYYGIVFEDNFIIVSSALFAAIPLSVIVVWLKVPRLPMFISIFETAD